MSMKDLVVRLTVWLAIYAIAMLGCVYTVGLALSILPQAREYRVYELAPSELERVRVERELPMISGQSGFQGFIRTENRTGGNVAVMQTDDYFIDIQPLRLIRGRMDYGTETETSRDKAVISEEMAVKLFLSVNVIGHTVFINDTPMTVEGVYSESSFLRRMSEGNIETVYIPFGSTVLEVPNTVDTLFISDDDAQMLTLYMLNETNKALGDRLGSRNENLVDDYSVKRKLLEQVKQLMWLGSGIVFAVFLAAFPCRFPQRVVFLAAAAVVLALVSFELLIPAGFLPSDRHILNLPYYWDLAVQRFAEKNSEYRMYDSVYFNALVIAAGSAAVSVVSAAAAALAARRICCRVL